MTAQVGASIAIAIDAGGTRYRQSGYVRVETARMASLHPRNRVIAAAIGLREGITLGEALL